MVAIPPKSILPCHAVFTDTNMGVCADPGQKQGSRKLQGSASAMERAIRAESTSLFPGRFCSRLKSGSSGCG